MEKYQEVWRGELSSMRVEIYIAETERVREGVGGLRLDMFSRSTKEEEVNDAHVGQDVGFLVGRILGNGGEDW